MLTTPCGRGNGASEVMLLLVLCTIFMVEWRRSFTADAVRSFNRNKNPTPGKKFLNVMITCNENKVVGCSTSHCQISWIIGNASWSSWVVFMRFAAWRASWAALAFPAGVMNQRVISDSVLIASSIETELVNKTLFLAYFCNSSVATGFASGVVVIRTEPRRESSSRVSSNNTCNKVAFICTSCLVTVFYAH